MQPSIPEQNPPLPTPNIGRKDNLNRRDFFKLLGVAATGALLPACQTTPNGEITITPHTTTSENPLHLDAVAKYNWAAEQWQAIKLDPAYIELGTVSETDRQSFIANWHSPIKFILPDDFSTKPPEEQSGLLVLSLQTLITGPFINNLAKSGIQPLENISALLSSRQKLPDSTDPNRDLILSFQSFRTIPGFELNNLAFLDAQVVNGGVVESTLAYNSEPFSPRVPIAELPTPANLATLTAHEIGHYLAVRSIVQVWKRDLPNAPVNTVLVDAIESHRGFTEAYAHAYEFSLIESMLSLAKTDQERTTISQSFSPVQLSLVEAWKQSGRRWRSETWIKALNQFYQDRGRPQLFPDVGIPE